MSELKPCPDCPTYAVCEHCGASHDTRPAPELPDGYRDAEGCLWCGSRLVAQKRTDDDFFRFAEVYTEDAPALAIWLQRGSK